MIKFLDLHKVNARFESEFQDQFTSFLNSGHYILGQGVHVFETNYAAYCGAKYCIGVSNGLDALILILKAYMQLGKLEKGDEVIVPANTFIASILALLDVGLKPVLVEPDEKTFNASPKAIEKQISSRSKAIMIVHLYGQIADMGAIAKLAKTHGLLVIEDAAQAHGAIHTNNKRAGNLSDAAAFSFYPAKNLGALGDAGAITTNDEVLAKRLKAIRNYGSSKKYVNDYLGKNNRLDDIQARFLNIKLKHLDNDNDKRRNIATRYLSRMKNDNVLLPFYNDTKNHVFYTFVVRVKQRDHFVAFLENHGVETLIHYPIAPHKQEALKAFKYIDLPITEQLHKDVVSIPISPVMEDHEVDEVIDVINRYESL